jgi:hypothetical protein
MGMQKKSVPMSQNSVLNRIEDAREDDAREDDVREDDAREDDVRGASKPNDVSPSRKGSSILRKEGLRPTSPSPSPTSATCPRHVDHILALLVSISNEGMDIVTANLIIRAN